MLRPLYLATLLILQLALVVKVAPPLAQALRVDALAGLAPGGWPAMLQLIATGLAVAGAALALVFPGVALSRHRRSGTHPLSRPAALGRRDRARRHRAARRRRARPRARADLAGRAARDRLSRRATRHHGRPRAGHRRRALRRAPAPQRRRRSASPPVRNPGAIEVTYPPDLRTARRESGMSPGNSRNYWIGVVSKDHVDIGVAGGFTQVNHGKAGPLERMRAGDGFAFYSPRTAYPDGELLQAFTAIGRIRNGTVYQVTVERFVSSVPARRRLLSRAAGARAAADRRALVHPQQDPLGRRVSLWRRAGAGGRFRADRRGDGPLFASTSQRTSHRPRNPPQLST